MTDVKPGVKDIASANWNKEILNAVSVAKTVAVPGRDLHVKLGVKGLAVVKSDMYCGVTNGKRMILDFKFDTIDIVENGWMVAGRYGIYKLYNKDGNMYKGLSFLKKSNAIRFARML